MDRGIEMRKEIFRYVRKKYKTEPDYPFSSAPTYAVLCHADNRKWFALIMDIPREKLGLKELESDDHGGDEDKTAEEIQGGQVYI